MHSFRLPWPPSVNHYWRQFGKATLISKPGRMYRMAVAVYVARTGFLGTHGTLTGRLAVTLTAYPPDRRERDLDNLPKAVLDSLTHARVWGDDSQIDDLRIVRGPVEKDGALVVEIAPIGAQVVA